MEAGFLVLDRLRDTNPRTESLNPTGGCMAQNVQGPPNGY
jgi:hypothetical protein